MCEAERQWNTRNFKSYFKNDLTLKMKDKSGCNAWSHKLHPLVEKRELKNMINKIIIKKAYKIYPHYYIILFTQTVSTEWVVWFHTLLKFCRRYCCINWVMLSCWLKIRPATSLSLLQFQRTYKNVNMHAFNKNIRFKRSPNTLKGQFIKYTSSIACLHRYLLSQLHGSNSLHALGMSR